MKLRDYKVRKTVFQWMQDFVDQQQNKTWDGNTTSKHEQF